LHFFSNLTCCIGHVYDTTIFLNRPKTDNPK
jgi:hypothetical protein